MEKRGLKKGRSVVAVQFILLLAFWAFAISVIGWIVHVIRLAWWLNDVPSASIAISLIAIPLFLTLLGVVNYVFWGIRAGRKGN